MSRPVCVICGHSKYDHASSLKGEAGRCLKEIVKDWEYCYCPQFHLPEKEEPDETKEGAKHEV